MSSRAAHPKRLGMGRQRVFKHRDLARQCTEVGQKIHAVMHKACQPALCVRRRACQLHLQCCCRLRHGGAAPPADMAQVVQTWSCWSTC